MAKEESVRTTPLNRLLFLTCLGYATLKNIITQPLILQSYEKSLEKTNKKGQMSS